MNTVVNLYRLFSPCT